MSATLRRLKKEENSFLPCYETAQEVAKRLEPYTIKVRRALHEIPELGWEEEKTLILIRQEIDKAIRGSALTFSLIEAKGGLWLDLTIDPSWPRILFRADIDGLPIQEETGLPFASKHPGRMHACGHDCHSAMLLSALQAIAEGSVKPEVNIRFVWQRAEEFAQERSGGQSLVEEGVLEGVDHVFGLHISSTLSSGTFFSKPGIMMANTTQVYFGIECSGGHVMHPHIGSNAIHIMMDIHNALRGYERCYFSPEEPIAFVPSIAKSGVAANVRPSRADLCYALRNFLPIEKREEFVKIIKERISHIMESHKAASLSYFNYIPGYPPLSIDEGSYKFVESLLEKSGQKTALSSLIFAGEDFTYYLQKKPGSFWILGARQAEGWDHHTPYFNPDELALWQGTAFWLLLATHPPSQ